MMILPFVLRAENKSIEQPDKSGLMKKIIPSYTKLQYAGSMGMFSVGCGWGYVKKRLETDLMFGMAPSSYSFENEMLYIVTLKQNYFPWNIKIRKNISFEPLATGAYATIVTNNKKNLWVTLPEKYDRDYYWHSSRLRIHAYIGERITFDLKKNKSIKAISLFYEIGTCDLYIAKAVNDDYHGFYNYLTASLGARLSF